MTGRFPVVVVAGLCVAGFVSGAARADGVVQAQESNVAKVFRVVPVRPVAELLQEARQASPPLQAAGLRKPDLVDLATLSPDFRFDVRYATSRNFLGVPVYSSSHAFMERPAAEALGRVLGALRAQGYGLLVFDAYRPWYITKVFWDATPADKHRFVANPDPGSMHNRGCAADLTLYDLRTGEPVSMPSGYDEMTARAYSDYPGGTAAERAAREVLRKAMMREGFLPIPEEWWHFDYKDWALYPVQNMRFEDIGPSGR
ncbi:M15 family metallopeptidase [Acetobacter oeni]|uniref:D-alanyl-D-alanine dipeptidase n=2 Tax=Acetobacter oeni TaxID=304077 RepID=A0A511XH93_9PROT|nr:M15 family metallopeptidase [Acetobacter oeni]NHO18447.1 D-alanyl-D-alanine dipeptidase [Acetobacter oeni]GBR03285.1 peptidase M15D [Acetobacter oeni LMG 21952]GEN62314.1 hypothetical protein AOE01nite_05380 [Acetobacter oeni]